MMGSDQALVVPMHGASAEDAGQKLIEDEGKIICEARGMIQNGALSSCAALLTSATESRQPSDDITLLLAEVQFKLLDFSAATSLLGRLQVLSPEAQALRKRIRDVLTDQLQRGTAIWDTLVWSNLDTIQRVDRPSWLIMLGRLYHLAYTYTAGDANVCEHLHHQFTLQVRNFARTNLLVSYLPNHTTVTEQLLAAIMDEAHAIFQHFSGRLTAIFYYLDRYYLRLHNFHKLDETCRRAFLYVYFENAIWPEIEKIWILSLKKDIPVLVEGLQRAVAEYIERLPDEGRAMKQRLRNKQRILCISGSFPTEILQHVFTFMV